MNAAALASTRTVVAALPHHHHHHRRLCAPPSPSPLRLRLRAAPPLIRCSSDQSSSSNNVHLQQWDSLTATFSGASNVPFLLLQMPQIVLNARNLSAGNKSALLAVPWLGMLTGLLGNLSLLSYFAKKREKEVMLVQTLGVLSQFVVLTQLTLADAMPLPFFALTSAVVAAGLLLNFLHFFRLLSPPSLWLLWEDFITVGGLSVLPQVMWSTFVPALLPSTVVPAAVAFVVAVTAVGLARAGKLSQGGARFVGAISGWTATLLFMWMPVSQMWTNFLNPDNIRGLSSFSMLLAMIGNGLMIPRSLLTRDFMWFIGSCWATFFYGYGNLVCMFWFKSIQKEFFVAATVGLLSWVGLAFWRDAAVHGYATPFTSLKELVFGTRERV